MRTIDAALRVTKTKENCDDIPKLEKCLTYLFELEGLEYHEHWNNWSEENVYRQRLKGYWINKWLCTDTHVGEMAYFLDDELVFTCEQTARKSDAAIYFVDQAAYDKVKVFMDYFREPVELPTAEFIGEQQTPDTVTREWADSCLHKRGFYQGREVEVGHIPYNVRPTLTLPGSESPYFLMLFPFVYMYDNGERSIVDIKELQFGIFIDGK